MQTSISPSRSKSALDERSRLCVCVERRIYWSWLSLPGWRSLLHDHRHRWMSASRLCIFRLSIKLFRQHGWTQLASSSHLCILCSYSSMKTPVRVSMLCIYNCRTLYGLLSHVYHVFQRRRATKSSALGGVFHAETIVRLLLCPERSIGVCYGSTNRQLNNAD